MSKIREILDNLSTEQYKMMIGGKILSAFDGDF